MWPTDWTTFTTPLSREQHINAIRCAIRFYSDRGLAKAFIAYGFGCDCPDAELYQDRSILLRDVLQFIADAEAADYYHVGKDNLHLKEESGRSEFMFCHESQVYFQTDDLQLRAELLALWEHEGWLPVRPPT